MPSICGTGDTVWSNKTMILLQQQAFDVNDRNPWYYEQQDLGWNYRLNDMACALANSQLKKLSQFVQKRAALRHRYETHLENNSVCALGEMASEYQRGIASWLILRQSA